MENQIYWPKIHGLWNKVIWHKSLSEHVHLYKNTLKSILEKIYINKNPMQNLQNQTNPGTTKR